MKKVLKYISVVISTIGVIGLIGTAGSSDIGVIDMREIVIRIMIFSSIIAIGVIFGKAIEINE